MRCGNLHSSDEKTTIHVEGFNESIKILVARCREQYRKTTYLEVVLYACEEDDVVRAEIKIRNGTKVSGRTADDPEQEEGTETGCINF